MDLESALFDQSSCTTNAVTISCPSTSPFVVDSGQAGLENGGDNKRPCPV